MHNYARIRHVHLQSTRKVGCQAKIVMRYVTIFNQDCYSGVGLSTSQKDDVFERLQGILASDSQYEGESRIYVKLPTVQEHTNHNVTCNSALSKRLHPTVIKQINELVSSGITHVPLVKSSLHHFVKTEFMNEEHKPTPWDRSFYPLSRDIRNHVHSAIVAGSFADIDQENIRLKIQQWQNEDLHRNFFYRPATFLNDEKDHNKNFLFIHQEGFQKYLMNMYGNTLCLLDATYKTSKYALPLFMLVVKTNVDYVPVAEFVVEDEFAETIQEALDIIKSWNPSWCPRYFMVDNDDAEIKAVHSAFPQVIVRLCAFHREQAWERWTKKGKNSILKVDFVFCFEVIFSKHLIHVRSLLHVTL